MPQYPNQAYQKERIKKNKIKFYEKDGIKTDGNH